MALCERCQAEIIRPQDRLPEPWFNHDAHLIGRECVSPRLWQVLELLWRRRGRIVARESIMALLYGDRNDPPGQDILNVYVCLLRKKLGATPVAILSARGLGFQAIDNRAAGGAP